MSFLFPLAFLFISLKFNFVACIIPLLPRPNYRPSTRVGVRENRFVLFCVRSVAERKPLAERFCKTALRRTRTGKSHRILNQAREFYVIAIRAILFFAPTLVNNAPQTYPYKIVLCFDNPSQVMRHRLLSHPNETPISGPIKKRNLMEIFWENVLIDFFILSLPENIPSYEKCL